MISVKEKPRARATTMQKIAHAAGVSVSTVSRVLNSPGFATKQTRDSVLNAASKMGYLGLKQRIIAASDLREEGQLNSILLLAPDRVVSDQHGRKLSEWIYHDVVPTLQRVAKEKGFRLVLSSDMQWEETRGLEQVCGVVWVSHAQEDLLRRIAGVVPVVVLNDDSFWPPRTSVMADDRTAIYAALDHLHGLGHRSIAYFDVDESPQPQNIHTRNRVAAFHEAIGFFNLNFDPAMCVLEKFGVNEHPQAVARAMDRMTSMKTPPTALVTGLGYAIQFLKETRHRGIKVPDHLSIVAMDDAPAAELVDPALTTIDFLFGRCAELAIELLLEQKTQQKGFGNRKLLLEPKLVVRSSTAKVKKSG